MMKKGVIVASSPTAANTLGQPEDSEAGRAFGKPPAWCFPERAPGSASSARYYLESLGEPLCGKAEVPPSQAPQSAHTPACSGLPTGAHGITLLPARTHTHERYFCERREAGLGETSDLSEAMQARLQEASSA